MALAADPQGSGTRLSRRRFGALALASAAMTGSGGLAAQARLAVAAVNYPLAYFAERLAGGIADVSFPVPSGTDPSFWRPGIADISAIQSADLILLNGAGFADWTARTTLPRSRIVDTSAAFEDAFIATETITHSHGEGGAHSHTGIASYTWLDFAQARQQAEAVARALIRLASEAEPVIAANLSALSADLGALAAEAERIGGMAAGLPMIASHPRYQYFARAYGMRIDAVDWDARDAASEAQWQSLGELARDSGARIFLWEAAPGAAARDRIETLGLANVVFPPLANRPEEGDFISAMTQSLGILRQAVQLAAGG